MKVEDVNEVFLCGVVTNTKVWPPRGSAGLSGASLNLSVPNQEGLFSISFSLNTKPKDQRDWFNGLFQKGEAVIISGATLGGYTRNVEGKEEYKYECQANMGNCDRTSNPVPELNHATFSGKVLKQKGRNILIASTYAGKDRQKNRVLKTRNIRVKAPEAFETVDLRSQRVFVIGSIQFKNYAPFVVADSIVPIHGR